MQYNKRQIEVAVCECMRAHTTRCHHAFPVPSFPFRCRLSLKLQCVLVTCVGSPYSSAVAPCRSSYTGRIYMVLYGPTHLLYVLCPIHRIATLRPARLWDTFFTCQCTH